MKLFRTVTQLIHTAIHQSGRERTRRALLQMSDRQLDDTGFSKELLQTGIHAWPWREDATAATTPVVMSVKPSEHQAVAELQAYSDRELTDLGLSRGNIETAVAFGRPGIDEQRRAA